MNAALKLPFYVRMSILLIGLYVLFSMLSIMEDIILPLIYATIIAISISPMVNFLVEKKINRAISIAGILIIAILLFGMVIILLSSQASLLREAWPRLANKFQELLTQTANWASEYFDIRPRTINAWISNAEESIVNKSSAFVNTTLAAIGGILTTAVLTPVYIFMILFYQPHLVKFTHRLFGAGNDNRTTEILFETKKIVQSYLFGLFVEFVIIAVLNSMGLLMLGIDYAILLGIVGALLNVIPYIGGIIAVALFMVIALVTKSPVYVFYVVGLYTIIQFIDNNFIVPKIVGSKVKLNALVSMIAVIAGAALWGIPGMFLSIPLIAIIKLILDRIESLKPWGFLLGDTAPPLLKIKPILKRK
jgi:predicted PurR-regulated permease PerM